ncbi:hypothetical protein U0070_007653, partial [Myodes glareolus]
YEIGFHTILILTYTDKEYALATLTTIPSSSRVRDKISGPITRKKFKDSQKVVKPVRSMTETRGDGKLKETSKNRGKKHHGRHEEREKFNQKHGRDVEKSIQSWTDQLGLLSSFKPQIAGTQKMKGPLKTTKLSATGGTLDGRLMMPKDLVSSKSLNPEDMCDHLIPGNVDADAATQLCESAVSKLEGKAMGTFSIVTSAIKQALPETADCSGTVSHRHALEYMATRHCQPPCVVTFCGGVQRVERAATLAKIACWLRRMDSSPSLLLTMVTSSSVQAVWQVSHGPFTKLRLLHSTMGQNWLCTRS